VAVLYFYTDQYLVNPIAEKFAPAGLPEIFSIKGNVSKLLIGLAVSWTTAAFLEEIVFRGYLINRFIDLFGETLLTKVIIVLLTGIAFGLVHSYQGLNGVISTGCIGVLVLDPKEDGLLFLSEQRQLLDTYVNQIVHALERARSAEQAKYCNLKDAGRNTAKFFIK